MKITGDMIGKKILVSMGFFSRQGVLRKREEFYGKIVFVDKVITVKATDGSLRKIPAAENMIQKAKPGIYMLRSTGVQVKDPDYISIVKLVEQAAPPMGKGVRLVDLGSTGTGGAKTPENSTDKE